jgi:hypothetical protein
MAQDRPEGGERPPRQGRDPAIAAAALLFVLTGVGWLVAHGYAVTYYVVTHERPFILGFQAGSGRIYETYGPDAAVLAMGLFAMVSAISLVAAFWLWQSRRRGAILAAITIAIGPIFWYGFGLPIPPWIAALQVVLLVAGWRSLH